MGVIGFVRLSSNPRLDAINIHFEVLVWSKTNHGGLAVFFDDMRSDAAEIIAGLIHQAHVGPEHDGIVKRHWQLFQHLTQHRKSEGGSMLGAFRDECVILIFLRKLGRPDEEGNNADLLAGL